MRTDADDQILRGVAATCTASFLDQDGDVSAASGTVTCTITRADGTAIATGRSTTTASNVHSVALTASETATLDLLTLSWLDAGTARTTTTVEVVGGYYFTVAQARSSDPALADAAKWSDADIKAARRLVADEFERICHVAFVPRYRRETFRLDAASDVLWLPQARPTSVRAVTVDGTAQSDLSDIELVSWGALRWPAGWTAGVEIVVGWESGYPAVPARIREVAIRRCRSLLGLSRSPMPDRQARFMIEEGRTVAFSGAYADKTGDDEVDSVLARYTESGPV